MSNKYIKLNTLPLLALCSSVSRLDIKLPEQCTALGNGGTGGGPSSGGILPGRSL